MKDFYNIVLVVTGTDKNLIAKMLDSISVSNLNLDAMCIVVNQGEVHDFAGFDPDVKTIQVNKRISLSKARNTALDYISAHKLSFDHILFPDDDTVYRNDFFEILEKTVHKKKAYLSRICNENDLNDYKPYPKKNIQNQKLQLLPYVASVSFVLPHELVKKVGYFDENLGAGAKWASSEDIDYFLRCIRFSTFDFIHSLVTFHPSRFAKYDTMTTAQIKQRFKAYSDGYIYVFIKYGMASKIMGLPFRALAGAFVSLLKMRFRLVPVYVWLFFYRLNVSVKLMRLKRFDPKFFKE